MADATITTSTIHTLSNGEIIDPTADKDPRHWLVERDPPPDIHVVSFQNLEIGYISYDPPKGFTAEEIMEFEGAKDCLTLEETKALIAERDEKGTLSVTGEARWAGLEGKMVD
ncbi:hypothetical protein CVT26_004350 [Gymnopilus dilepis]|uniref:Uncharacterized protein n=1 Tax=Gymnopilus dilepis TaxID=231916 RepID=A0A409W2D2_9AGAR|nr:hypothetical protein CVT26_004350 [Gymnopilus dilepis]